MAKRLRQQLNEALDQPDQAVVLAASAEELDVAITGLSALLDEALEALDLAVTFASSAEELDTVYTNIHERLRREFHAEQQQRIAAQNGLVLYVQALEAFDKWLGQRPELRQELEPTLRSLGLWEIKLGYDPMQDLSLTVASARRFSG